MPDAAPPTTAESPAIEACKRDSLKSGLAYGSLAYLVLFTVLIVFKGVPDGKAGDMLDLMAMASTLLVKDAFGFVFGSSQGSQDKTAALAASTPTAPTTP